MRVDLQGFANALTWECGHPCPPSVLQARSMVRTLRALMRAGMPALPGSLLLINPTEVCFGSDERHLNKLLASYGHYWLKPFQYHGAHRAA